MDYDGMAILKDAKNVDEALEFIDYMMRPEVIAKVTNDIGYANANEKATPLVDETIRGDPAMYPDQSRMKNILHDRRAHRRRHARADPRIHARQDGAVGHTALFSSWSDLVRPSTSSPGQSLRSANSWTVGQARP